MNTVETKVAEVEEELNKARATLEINEDGIVDRGALVVLVPTDKPIHEWEPIAQRHLPDVVWLWPRPHGRS